VSNPDNAARRLTRQLLQTSREYELLMPGDRVLVALSGGKDSYTLLDLLHAARGALPGVELVAVHLDQQQPGYAGEQLVAWLRAFGVRFEILSEDTYSLVTEQISAEKTYCSLCSRLRRGILYTAAERLRCNKIALGHHRDDALETLLMNLFFSGRLQAMPAKYRTDDGRFEVIRPLIECDEPSIIQHARARAFPILPCNLCGSQSGLQRTAMKRLLDQLATQHPNVRAVMLAALRNVSPSHLLDTSLLALLAAQPANSAPTPIIRASGHRALPLISG